MNTSDGIPPNAPDNEPAPLVDEALASTAGNASNNDALETLRLEVAHLQQALAEARSSARHIARTAFSTQVQKRPISVAIAVGVFSYVFAVTR